MVAFDLHIHSKYSFDSNLEPRRIIDIAKRKGLKGIAITDHNTIKANREAEQIAQNELIVICGTEINTEVGDIVGLFIDRDIHSRKFVEVVDEIKNQGGLAILAHPYKRGRKVTQEMIKKIDAIEAFNARNGVHNLEALRLSQQYDLPIVGGSDAHFAFEIGRGRTIFNGLSDLRMDNLKQAIIKGQTQTTGKRSLTFLDILSQGIRFFKDKPAR